MTDAELEAIRQREAAWRDGFMEPGICDTDVNRLLAELDSLRGKHADEPWLASICKELSGWGTDHMHVLSAEDGLRLLAHIDALASDLHIAEAAIHDLLEDSGQVGRRDKIGKTS